MDEQETHGGWQHIRGTTTRRHKAAVEPNTVGWVQTSLNSASYAHGARRRVAHTSMSVASDGSAKGYAGDGDHLYIIYVLRIPGFFWAIVDILDMILDLIIMGNSCF